MHVQAEASVGEHGVGEREDAGGGGGGAATGRSDVTLLIADVGPVSTGISMEISGGGT